ncbi:MAG: PadR family transcriptional regulator, partial [Candidatus Accumulibacter sp.]|nr:PadR family transcriptional regulator [Accumulibacter sp.]
MHSHFFSEFHGGHGHHHFGHMHAHPGFPFGGGGGRRERIFASGDLKFVILHLLGRKPAHGYEIIKAMSELVG